MRVHGFLQTGPGWKRRPKSVVRHRGRKPLAAARAHSLSVGIGSFEKVLPVISGLPVSFDDFLLLPGILELDLTRPLIDPVDEETDRRPADARFVADLHVIGCGHGETVGVVDIADGTNHEPAAFFEFQREQSSATLHVLIEIQGILDLPVADDFDVSKRFMAAARQGKDRLEFQGRTLRGSKNMARRFSIDHRLQKGPVSDSGLSRLQTLPPGLAVKGPSTFTCTRLYPTGLGETPKALAAVGGIRSPQFRRWK